MSEWAAKIKRTLSWSLTRFPNQVRVSQGQRGRVVTTPILAIKLPCQELGLLCLGGERNK